MRLSASTESDFEAFGVVREIVLRNELTGGDPPAAEAAPLLRVRSAGEREPVPAVAPPTGP